MTEEIVFARKASGLVRELTVQDVIIWGIAAPAASGINFYSVRMSYSYPGASPVLSFALSALILLPLAIALAMMSSAMPRAGGMYVMVSRIINPTIGYYCVWVMVIGWGIAIGLLGYLVTGLFGGALVMAGLGGGGAGLIETGKALGTTTWSAVGGILFTLFFWALNLYSMGAVKWVTRIMTYLPMVATVVAVVYFIGVGPAGAPSAFNNIWGSGTYEKILEAAAANGFAEKPFSWDATISSLIIPLWAWTAFEASTFVSGEVKSPRKSMLYGFIGGFGLCALLYIVVSWAVYFPYGKFVGAYTFLANAHPDVLAKIMPVIRPGVPLLSASVMPLWLGAIVSILLCLWFANSILPVFAACTRALFSVAFDRALPERFSQVNERGSPTWATHTTMIWGIVGVFITVASVDVILGILDWTMYNFYLWFGMAALLLPYLKPEIYKRSPIQWSVAGVPIISILGLLSIGVGFWIASFSILVEFTYSVAAMMAVFIAIGFIFYVWKQAKNVKEGIDLSRIYAEVPPE